MFASSAKTFAPKAARAFSTGTRVAKDNSHKVAAALGLGLGVGCVLTSNVSAAKPSTADTMADILARVKAIEADLGVAGKKAGAEKGFSAAANYPRWTTHNSGMSRNLTPELYNELKTRVTSFGFTIDQAIQCGVDLTHAQVGITAGDEECYEVYREIFDPVIESWHRYKPDSEHHTDMNPANLRGGELSDKYIISTRIRAGRGIRGLSLPPGTSRAERREVERLIRDSLTNLGGELKGKYFGLYSMTKEEEAQLIDDHFLFQKPRGGTLLTTCNAVRDWPDARGIFHNDEKTFLVWVNEEDHMRVISMQKGGNVRQVFTRFCEGIAEVEKCLKAEGREFMHSKRLGYIGTCPSNIGTGLRASVMIKLPLFSATKDWEAVLNKMHLQPRGCGGEFTASVGGVWDVSNQGRIGHSEVELVQHMVDGAEKLIELEQDLEAGRDISAKVKAILG